MDLVSPAPSGGYNTRAFVAVALWGAGIAIPLFFIAWAAVSIEAAYIVGCGVYVLSAIVGGVRGCFAPHRDARTRKKGNRGG